MKASSTSAGGRDNPLNASVHTLLDTPRRLKVVLRQVRTAWRELEGEVEPDALLLVEALRAITPRTIELIDQSRIGRVPLPSKKPEAGESPASALKDSLREDLRKLEEPLDRERDAIEWAPPFLSRAASSCSRSSRASIPPKTSCGCSTSMATSPLGGGGQPSGSPDPRVAGRLPCRVTGWSCKPSPLSEADTLRGRGLPRPPLERPSA